MGAITKFRQISPYGMAAILVLFVAFMVLQDSQCTQQTQQPGQLSVGEVNGEKISQAEFEKLVQAATEIQKQQDPNAPIDDEALRNQVFDMLVNKTLLRQEADKLGIHVTTDEIRYALLVNPQGNYILAQDSLGRIDHKIQYNFIVNPDKAEKYFTDMGYKPEDAAKRAAQWRVQLANMEDNVVQSRLDAAVQSVVMAATSVPSKLAVEADFEMTRSVADVNFIAVDINRAPADTNISDKEINDYYEKNKQYNIEPAGRRISYVSFPLVPSAKDTAYTLTQSSRLQNSLFGASTPEAKSAVFAEALSQYAGTSVKFTAANEIEPNTLTVLSTMAKGDVFGPLNTPNGIMYYRLDDKREGVNTVARASHILIPFGANKDSAKAKALEILGKAKGGDDFAMLAMQNSTDQGTAQKGGDLGYFGSKRMVPEFDSAVFASSSTTGSILGPVQTQFGYHIIKVTDKQSQEFAYSQVSLKIKMSPITRANITSKAQAIVEGLQAGKSFEELAKQNNAQLSKSAFFKSSTPVLGSRALTNWAYDSDQGSATRKELKNIGVVVAQLTDVRAEGIAPLDEDLKRQIKFRLIQRKRVASLKGLAERIANVCSQSGSLDAARSIDTTFAVRNHTGMINNGMITGYNNEFVVTNAAFKAPLNSISKPIQGERGWFILQVVNKQPADKSQLAKNRVILNQSMSNNIRSKAYQTWFTNLRDNATIINNMENPQ